MRIKVDENLPREVAEDLRSLGHVADTVEEEGLSGAAVGRRAVLTFVRGHLKAVTEHPIEGRITVVSERGIRIR